MHITSRSRRTAALMAASTIGLSTALLSNTGLASATTTPTWAASGFGVTSPVPAGICWIKWDVVGGAGGTDSDGNGGGGSGEAYVTLPATAGDTFSLYPGTAGAAASSASTGGTHGRNNYSADPTTAGTNGGDDGSGGGGAASVVTKSGSVYLLAFGGSGTGLTPGTGGGGGINHATGAPSDFDPSKLSGSGGDGDISGTGIPCAPDAPYLNSAEGDDRSLELDFVDQSTDPGDVPSVSYEWSHDNGVSWAPLTTTTDGGRIHATVTGLTNGTAYTVQVRALGGTDTVPSGASRSVTGTPVKRAGAPTNVKATVSAGTIHVSWAPPAGETDIVGYSAWALPDGQQSSSGLVECPHMDANARSCTLTVAPGRKYSVGVVADNGNGGNRVFVVTDTVPVPTTVPSGSGSLGSPSGKVSSLPAGQSVTLTGSGYEPFSTVSLYIYSTPTLLGTVVTDASGNFSVSVTVPANLAPGAHHLVSAGLDPSGHLRYLRTDVTVTPAANQLAWTGFNALPATIGGVLALLAGGGLILVARRRRTA